MPDLSEHDLRLLGNVLLKQPVSEEACQRFFKAGLVFRTERGWELTEEAIGIVMAGAMVDLSRRREIW